MYKLPQWVPAGYRCYHSGKWHVDGKVLDGGFDRSLNISNPGNMFTRRGTQRDDQPVRSSADEIAYYVTTGTADHAIECLREHAATHDGRPFFQYLAFHAPHFPLHALPEDIAKYRERYLEGWDVMRQRRYARQVELGIVSSPLSAVELHVGPPYRDSKALERLGAGDLAFPRPWDTITDEQRRFQAKKMAVHAAMVDRMDREIGRVLDQLKAMNAFENTLILFASDNGASAEIWVRDGGHDPQAAPGSEKSYLCLGPGFSTACNTPFRRHKTWVHEGGIATPLIVHWPAGFAARGELRHTPAHLIDFVPTVLDLLRLECPKEWQGEPLPVAPGKSLVPAFARDVTIERESLWWLHEENRALRVGDWKLVSAAPGDWELYDLRSDRGEQHNLAAKMPEKVAELSAVWQRQTDDFSSSVRRAIATGKNGS